jgi:hypothetical protein
MDAGYMGRILPGGASYGAGVPADASRGMYVPQGDFFHAAMLERLDAIVDGLGRIEKLLQARGQ